MKRLAALFVLAASIASAQTPGSQTATFQAGTRLVEVEVVVRNKTGPVTNLTKDDFTILDHGKRQRIDIFRAGLVNSAASVSVPLPPGAVSNRATDAGGTDSSASGYTVVLFDELNTNFDLKAYERKALLKLIRGLTPHEHVAIYVLGNSLHVLQEFTDDPAKLLNAVQRLDSGRDLNSPDAHDILLGFNTDSVGNLALPTGRGTAELAGEMTHSVGESAMNVAQVYGARNDETTIAAVTVIARHLSGMPGRRNLIWMKEKWTIPPQAIGLLQQARIALYLVLARSVEFDPSKRFMGNASNVQQALVPGTAPLMTLMPDIMDVQRKARQTAESTGGAGFGDASDVEMAVKTAEEDSRSAYTLGYYPAEDVLDGKFHSLTVKVAGEKKADLEIRYRPGYIATKQAVTATPLPMESAVTTLFQNPLDETGLGMVVQCDPDSTPGLYKVRLTLDLRDLHFIHEGGHAKGSIELAFLAGSKAKVQTIAIDLTDEQFAAALRDGYLFSAAGVPAIGSVLRVAARDPSTGVAGSLTIPVSKNSR